MQTLLLTGDRSTKTPNMEPLLGMKQDITVFFANVTVRVDTATDYTSSTTISDPVSGRSRPQVIPSVAKQAARRVAHLARMRRDADQGQAAFTAYSSTVTYLTVS